MFKFIKKEKASSCCTIQIEEVIEERCTHQEADNKHESATK
jgi:hypothetical protein